MNRTTKTEARSTFHPTPSPEMLALEIATLLEEEQRTVAYLEEAHTPQLVAHLGRIAARLYDRRYKLAALAAVAFTLTQNTGA